MHTIHPDMASKCAKKPKSFVNSEAHSLVDTTLSRAEHNKTKINQKKKKRIKLSNLGSSTMLFNGVNK